MQCLHAVVTSMLLTCALAGCAPKQPDTVLTAIDQLNRLARDVMEHPEECDWNQEQVARQSRRIVREVKKADQLWFLFLACDRLHEEFLAEHRKRCPDAIKMSSPHFEAMEYIVYRWYKTRSPEAIRCLVEVQLSPKWGQQASIQEGAEEFLLDCDQRIVEQCRASMTWKQPDDGM